MGSSATVFTGGNVVTLDPTHPSAEAVVVIGGRIAYVGDVVGALARGGEHARVVDLEGRTVVPGLIDPHVHLLATAAAQLEANCSVSHASGIQSLLELLRREVAKRGPGGWIKASGYDDELLWERRHPTRSDIDRVAPDHPVRLKHQTGHAVVLNSRACAALEIPVEKWGDGLFLDAPTGDSVDIADLKEACGRISRCWLEYGITRICDVGAANGLSEAVLLSEWRCDGTIRQELSMLFGEKHWRPCRGAAETTGISVDGVKVVLEEQSLTEARLDEITRLFTVRHPESWIAIHVVELGCLAILLDHLEVLRARGVPLARCRIEHLSLCPPQWMTRLRDLGVTVVTQPSFLLDRGAKYARTIPPEQYAWLYPVGRLLNAGVRVAASSDSPVADANPFKGMLAAMERRAEDGLKFGEPVDISRQQALSLYTTHAAAAVGLCHEVGRIRPGYRADLAILDRHPLQVAARDLPATRAVTSYVSGKVATLDS